MSTRTPSAESQLPLPAATFHILMALADEDRHGYAIIQEVAARTNGDVRLSTGTLYGLIKRFLDDELIVELPPEDEGNERRRPYKLTPFGRQVARAEAARLEQLVSAARGVRLLPEKG